MEAYASTPSPISMHSTAKAFDVDKLSYEIFSILESKFLFGGGTAASSYDSFPATPARPHAGGGLVRVLSIDGCGGVRGAPAEALLAAASLARLEAALQTRSGDPDARVADFFDISAGSGAGGVLAAMLFLRGPDGRPRYTAQETLSFVTGGGFSGGRKGFLKRMFHRRPSLSAKSLRKTFGESTLKDTVAPVLIPCYDLATSAPFMFSRADAFESDGFDFRLRDVCEATCAAAGGFAVAVRSIDGRTTISAAGGGAAAMGNPAAAAITHVLHNKQEFPLVAGVEDLLVVSIGTGGVSGAASAGNWWRTPMRRPEDMARITAEGVADMVDQAVAMAFGHNRSSSYIRIQADVCGHGTKDQRSTDPKKAIGIAESMLAQRNVESVLFRGRKLSEKTNAEMIDTFAVELAKENDRRRHSLLPVVVVKQAATPRLSSATTASTATITTKTVSSMPSPVPSHRGLAGRVMPAVA